MMKQMVGSKKGEAKQGLKVGMMLVKGLEGKGHVVKMDNFSTSVELSRNLDTMGNYGGIYQCLKVCSGMIHTLSLA